MIPKDDFMVIAADLAAVFHWSLSDIEDLELEDIPKWHKLALERFGLAHGKI